MDKVENATAKQIADMITKNGREQPTWDYFYNVFEFIESNAIRREFTRVLKLANGVSDTRYLYGPIGLYFDDSAHANSWVYCKARKELLVIVTHPLNPTELLRRTHELGIDTLGILHKCFVAADIPVVSKNIAFNSRAIGFQTKGGACQTWSPVLLALTMGLQQEQPHLTLNQASRYLQ
jgi:hypothetical protein